MIAAIEWEAILGISGVVAGIAALYFLVCLVLRYYEKWGRRNDSMKPHELRRFSDSNDIAQKSSLFSRDKFLLKYQLKYHDRLLGKLGTCDILDPDTGQCIGTSKPDQSYYHWREPKTVSIYEREGDPPVLSIHRPKAGWWWFSAFPDARVFTGDGQPLGYIRWWMWRREYEVFDASGRMAARVQSKYEGKVKFLDTKGPVCKLIAVDGGEIGREMAHHGSTPWYKTSHSILIVINQQEQAKVGVAERAMMLAVWLAKDIVFKPPESNTSDSD